MDDGVIHAQLAVFFFAALSCAGEILTVGRAQGKVAGGIFVKKGALEENAGIGDG